MCAVFERWGVEVRIDPDGENLVRGLGPRERIERGEVVVRELDRSWIAARARALGGPALRIGPSAPYVVEAQGMPNLAHEFAHVLLAGVLDDDHGIDYARIPLDVERAEDRQLMWDELACAWFSCGLLGCSLVDAREGAESPCDSEAVESQVDAWFAEQVEIQPVFYGGADDDDGRRDFAALVDRCLDRDGDALAATCARLVLSAEEHLRAALTPAGCSSGASPVIPPLDGDPLGLEAGLEAACAASFSRLWGAYTARWAGASVESAQ